MFAEFIQNISFSTRKFRFTNYRNEVEKGTYNQISLFPDTRVLETFNPIMPTWPGILEKMTWSAVKKFNLSLILLTLQTSNNFDISENVIILFSICVKWTCVFSSFLQFVLLLLPEVENCVLFNFSLFCWKLNARFKITQDSGSTIRFRGFPKFAFFRDHQDWTNKAQRPFMLFLRIL